SYSSVVKQSTSQTAPVSAALIRAATRERQVLFDPAPGHTLFPPEDTPIIIANKVSQALQTVRKDDDPEIEIKASQRLRNGGVVIELTTSSAAQWARAPANRQTIIEALGLQAQIKNRTFPIIVPFLPVSSPIDNREWINEVETENDMPPNSIEYIRWIKPKDRRDPNQRVAHAVFHYVNPKIANINLRDGIYIGKEKLHPRKDKREPVRCVRCQHWGHVAKECNATKDACGTC
ncbi:hypothetical protein DEU56DRAFT_691331, partial [Suillus clintonianus]|uniref:uncharacterized protein n=1 Tax=Suillus clintonianus TaxID=1904413 RepID=UPI001B86A743